MPLLIMILVCCFAATSIVAIERGRFSGGVAVVSRAAFADLYFRKGPRGDCQELANGDVRIMEDLGEYFEDLPRS